MSRLQYVKKQRRAKIDRTTIYYIRSLSLSAPPPPPIRYSNAMCENVSHDADHTDHNDCFVSEIINIRQYVYLLY